MKKLLTVITVFILALTCTFTLISCDTADFTVGICQLVTHDALDAATQGFMDALEEEVTKAGKTVKFDLQNAQNAPVTYGVRRSARTRRHCRRSGRRQYQRYKRPCSAKSAGANGYRLGAVRAKSRFAVLLGGSQFQISSGRS